MQNILNLLTKAALAFVASIALVGCASMPPMFPNYIDIPRDESRIKNGREVLNVNSEGVLFRGFVTFFRPDPDSLLDADGYEKALLWPSLETVLTEDGPLLTEYGGLLRYVNLDERYDRYIAAVGEFIHAGHASPAMRLQKGDLAEFLYYEVGTPLPFTAGAALLALRVVCKGWDEECIARENRSYRCDDGAMLIDGKRRPDRPCGGFGGHSEDWAAIVGPMEILYGSLDNYLRVHNSPYDKCLLHLSCGAAEGNAYKLGKYEEWLETRPNFLPAHEASSDYTDAHGDVPAEERAYMIYLWEEMLSPTPALGRAEFVRQWREQNAAATE